VSGLETTSNTAPMLRAALRLIGWSGLGLIAVAVALSDFLAHAPAGAVGIGPMLAAPSSAYPLGTDLLGRDVLSETLHGLSVTVGQALVAALVAIAVGGLLGAVAARLPRLAGLTLRGAMGVLAAIPALLLAILAIGLSARLYAPLAAGLAAAPLAFVRAYDRVEGQSGSTHAEYARATGIAVATLLRRDLTYEFRDTLATVAARALAAVTIILSTVSFLGFGATPPARDLGLMIAAAKANFLHAWWAGAFPAFALIVLILCARLAAGLDEGERP
jgi:ABC-type dipeptide/oligopeptide/nickel transport system permease subunit